MDRTDIFTQEEKREILELNAILLKNIEGGLLPTDYQFIKTEIGRALADGRIVRDSFGFHPVIIDMQTAALVGQEIGHHREIMISILLNRCVQQGVTDIKDIKAKFGDSVTNILTNLTQINSLYAKSPTIESENFRNLLLSFANDMRIILIMIAARLVLLRRLFNHDDKEARTQVATEASKLYIPLAHKLGFYKLKSEMEDLVMRYTESEIYTELSRKVEETAASREDYIASFIKPIEKRLKALPHLKYRIKGRTKSINSIWQKMKRQHRPFEQIYDLFAIRIIIDSEPQNEKGECWQVYSIVADQYTPNPHRLRDWLSVPKSNGYESLHTTVMGPEGRWVEVQIRTERMDTIAEHGLAAHWRYKGIKSEKGLDNLLASIRDTLQNLSEEDVNDNKFKMELYKDEIFIFTPKGDLYRLPKGATILDFAFSIHTGLGCKCTGALVNGRNVPIRHILNNGDQVEIITSNSQTPKQAWLAIAKTGRARAKIRQALKEITARQADIAREMLIRKFKNHKIEYDEGMMDHLIRKMGFKRLTNFYQCMAEGGVEISEVLRKYQELTTPQNEGSEITHSANGYTYSNDIDTGRSSDVLVIERNLKGVDYKLSRCCNPIFGDEIFGFVTISGGISIHRKDCSNAPELRERYPYRIIEARWSDIDKNGALFPVTLRIVGHDDIGIVNNITSIISQEKGVIMRGINIESHDTLFSGSLSLLIDDNAKLRKLIEKIEGVKGVKQVKRG
ncbi:MAG: bifunctional (p)ppGpp synthetase/guanosine-3',5'-bis(diphosphate) 3'-pyrophosphohydrolase [Bacteroidaceae bacterium]|nr:bifunctional (p)ppGpp synthetase/guanosine-3',5'-bis(diphosphate) 3'-pyrophosphohydrolase [Bacteroidaceae bacterium]MBQ8542271.1 bifunctional (p)ppGpp synthetase/guanosine-3',5'-bis(diphosphate) 3'-pyrophosphohydrolase [Bacteroidaceae bacterium]